MEILIVDKQAIVRRGLSSMLNSTGLARRIYEAESSHEAFKRVTQYPIEIVFIDINLPTRAGLEIISALRKQYPEIKILVISTFRNFYLINSILDLGVHGYIFKDDVTCETVLEFALNSVNKNRLFLSESLNKDEAYKGCSHYEQRPCVVSKAEADFIRLLSEGRGNKYISNYTGLAISSVGTYRKRLLRKFKVPNTTALIKYAYEVGLLEK